MNALAADGIRQIREHQYYTDMEYHGVETIILFGIAFSYLLCSWQIML